MSPLTRFVFSPALTALMVALSLSAGGVRAAGTSSPTKPAAAAKAKAAAPWVKVESAWVRAMVKGQTATGGFMSLTAVQPLTLEGFAMSRPGTPELHEMAMDGNVMRMRAIETLALPAGQAVVLRPGAQHLMLTELKEPLKDGDTVTLTLKLRTADGKKLTQDVQIPVTAGHMMMSPAQGASEAPAGAHHHGMHH